MKKYYEKVLQFIDFPWQEDSEIEACNLMREFRDKIKTANPIVVKEYLKSFYEANKENLSINCSDKFSCMFDELIK